MENFLNQIFETGGSILFFATFAALCVIYMFKPTLTKIIEHVFNLPEQAKKIDEPKIFPEKIDDENFSELPEEFQKFFSCAKNKNAVDYSGCKSCNSKAWCPLCHEYFFSTFGAENLPEFGKRFQMPDGKKIVVDDIVVAGLKMKKYVACRSGKINRKFDDCLMCSNNFWCNLSLLVKDAPPENFEPGKKFGDDSGYDVLKISPDTKRLWECEDGKFKPRYSDCKHCSNNFYCEVCEELYPELQDFGDE